MDIQVACVGYTGPHDAYWRSLGARELGPGDEQLPLKTLSRWRSKAPETARFVPRVCSSVSEGAFRGDEVEAGWAHTLAQVERLGASTLLLRTPPSFRPTGENRDALRAFFSAGRRPEGLEVAWWAEGLWDHEDHVGLCKEVDLVPAVDPLALDDDEPLPDGARFYWRLMGRKGLAGRFGDWDLDQLVGHAEGRSGHVVFTAPQMMRDARRFAVLAGAPPALVG